MCVVCHPRHCSNMEQLQNAYCAFLPHCRFSCETFLPCDPRRWMHRFLLLFLMCMLSFGSYYVYDNPAALERTILNVSLWGATW